MAALATGKVTYSALRKGMRFGLSKLGNPESFLQAHRESEARLAKARDLVDNAA